MRTITVPSAAARRSDGRPLLDVTVWYPATPDARPERTLIGPPGRPLFETPAAARDAAPETGRHPVVLMSHGFGGSAADMGWLAVPLAQAGYVVVAVDHPGNNALDRTESGAVAVWERSRDLLAALRAVREDAALRASIDPTRVGAAGFSIGASTALALAGARFDPWQFDAYCDRNKSDMVCQPPAEMPGTEVRLVDTIKRFGLEHDARRVATSSREQAMLGVLAIAPNGQILNGASLRGIRAKTTIVGGQYDPVSPMARHARFVSRLVPNARLVTVPGAAHYSFMATCTDRGREVVDVCRLAPGQDRAHTAAVDAAMHLFLAAMPPGSRPRRATD